VFQSYNLKEAQIKVPKREVILFFFFPFLMVSDTTLGFLLLNTVRQKHLFGNKGTFTSVANYFYICIYIHK
jgi:hypothetical protein